MSDLNPAVLDIFSPPNVAIWPKERLAEIAKQSKVFAWIPVEMLSWHRETRPSRLRLRELPLCGCRASSEVHHMKDTPRALLGPAASEATLRARGVCPGCGLPYEACRIRTGLYGLRAPGGKNV